MKRRLYAEIEPHRPAKCGDRHVYFRVSVAELEADVTKSPRLLVAASSTRLTSQTACTIVGRVGAG
ncbi:hypothetical protein ACVWY3_004893 [Bradyrhizobium sp. USDA 4486]